MAEELPKRRRPSLGSLQAVKAKHLVHRPHESGGTYDVELFNLAKFIFTLSEEIYDKARVTLFTNPLEEIPYISEGLECVGVILSFNIGHCVPFVRVGDVWYNGDNEVGFLRRRQSRPSMFMQYAGTDVQEADTPSTVVSALCFYVERSLITAIRGGQDGTIVFGQTDKTCAPDALQTVLMFANGLYEYYNEGLYSQLKGLFPPRRPKDMQELRGNIQAADKKKYVSLLSSDEVTPESRGPILFLLVMFNRYSYIERLEERPGEEFEVVANMTRARGGRRTRRHRPKRRL